MGIKRIHLYYLFASLLIFFISACSTSKKSAKKVVQNPVVVVPKAEQEAVKKDTVHAPASHVKIITVALLLPLKLQEHFAADTSSGTTPLIIQEAVGALNLYEGALMAAESLNNTKRKINFRIIDTGFDSLSTVVKINTTNMSDVDAVVSFLPANFSSLLGKVSNRWTIPMYFFSASNTSILEKNKWIRLVNPSNYTQITETADFIASRYADEKIFAIYRDVRGESEISKLFAEVIDSLLQKPSACTLYQYKADGFTGLKTKLSKSKTNVLILPTSDESFLSSLLNKLNEEKENYKFALIGMPSWENFNSLDPELMKELGGIIFNGMYIDTKSKGLKDFRKKFIMNYHADPLMSAYMGYDVIHGIISELENSGVSKWRFQSLLNSGREIELTPVCENCGYETKAINLLKYGNFEFDIIK